MTECVTVADLIRVLQTLPQEAVVISLSPPFTGVTVIPQNSGNILISRPRRADEKRAAA